MRRHSEIATVRDDGREEAATHELPVPDLGDAPDRDVTDRDTTDPTLTLGRYRLGRRLGSGGFGSVHAAHDERLDRAVAIKILPRERVIHSRFEREARAAARLHHPGIVTLFEAAVDDDGAYLVSELVKGTTLDGALARGELSDRDILAVAVALADALEHAHAHAVVHRDVKPQNVLIPARRGKGQNGLAAAKLTDFGVARVVGGDTLTRTGDVVGTLAYMSPEQAEGRETGPQSDLYSLALLTYEALTGVNPVADNIRQGRNRRLGAYLPPLRRQRADLPRHLGAAIDQALRPRPSERGTVADLGVALTACLGLVDDTPGVVAPARALAVPRTVTQTVARRGGGASGNGRDGTRDGDGEEATRRPGPEWDENPRRRSAPVLVPTAQHRTTPLELAPGGLLLLAGGLLAVGLGALGLAAAWPALVSQTVRGWWRRALAAAGGLAWLGLASILTPQDFLFSLRGANLDAQTLEPVGIVALIWAAAAAFGPLLTRHRRPTLDLTVVTVTSAAVAVGVASAGLPHLEGLVPGALIGWLIAAYRPLIAVVRGAVAARALP